MRYNAVHNVEQQIEAESCVVRGTHARKGRNIWLEPGRSPMSQLHYGRIILDPCDAPVRFGNHHQETGLICLKGVATVSVAEQTFELVPYDSLYIPRDSEMEVKAEPDGCDLAEVSAP